MIRDQSYLNMIAIESRTQGDQKELTNLHKNFLISSGFNRNLSLQRKRTSIYRDFIAKIVDRPIRLKDD